MVERGFARKAPVTHEERVNYRYESFRNWFCALKTQHKRFDPLHHNCRCIEAWPRWWKPS